MTPCTFQPAFRFFRCFALLAVLCATQAAAADRLPAYNVDKSRSSVSGLSSGGYMAVQFHLSHAATLRGAGVLAGGPYYCAQAELDIARSTCMEGEPRIEPLMEHAERQAAAGRIDPLTALAGQRVWLFSGYNDGVVRPPVVRKLQQFYRRYLPEHHVFFKDNLRAGHSQVTLDSGGACDLTGGEFISDCDYDAAGVLLQHIHGRLNPRNSGRLQGKLIRFDQREFVNGGPRSSGLAESGFAYVPADCAHLAPCRVHIAFHGCKQYEGRIGQAFVTGAGYNRWADANRIIVLYPQTSATRAAPYNPNGCWDWWGYTGKEYAEKNGPQIAAVKAMLDRLAEGFAGSVETGAATAIELEVIDTTATSAALAWTPAAAAGGYDILRWSGGAPLRLNRAPVSGASFADSGLAPDTRYSYQVVAAGTAGAVASRRVEARTAAEPPRCEPYFSDNAAHVKRGRAYVWWGYTYARGSGEPMGWWNTFTDTFLRREGDRYRVGTCP